MDGRESPPTSLKSRGPYVAVFLVLLALAIAGAVTWFVLNKPQPIEPVADAGTPVVDAGVAEAPGLDPAGGDVLVGDLVPKEWLAGGDVVRRAATAVYAVSEGQSPRIVLPFLEPGGEFLVDEVAAPGAKPTKRKLKKGAKPPKGPAPKYFISDENDARYDAVTKAFTAIDAAAVGRAYGKLRPYLDGALKEIAPKGTSFDDTFTKAVDRLAAVPIADGPREVVPMEVGIGYRWADPKLEALKPAEKHLLRMGPKNARAVVAQLKAFRAAMNEGETDAGP